MTYETVSLNPTRKKRKRIVCVPNSTNCLTCTESSRKQKELKELSGNSAPDNKTKDKRKKSPSSQRAWQKRNITKYRDVLFNLYITKQPQKDKTARSRPFPYGRGNSLFQILLHIFRNDGDCLENTCTHCSKVF